MTNLTHLTISQLRNIVAMREQIESLQGEIDLIARNGGEIPIPPPVDTPQKRRMSASSRAKIAAAKARWAKVRAAKGEVAPKKRQKMSAAWKAKLAAAARARWAKAKAAGKTTL